MVILNKGIIMILTKALNDSGILDTDWLLPIKSFTEINTDNNSIRFGFGYSAKIETI